MNLNQSIRASTVAELSWVGAEGRPDSLPVVPLLLEGEPAVAYPYAYAALARQIVASPEVALTVSDPRMTGSPWYPLTTSGRSRLIEDPEGELFTAELLRQELRKYPPSRTLADSLLLRRENWWYVPRLIIVLNVDPPVPVEPREGDDAQVLTVWDGNRLHVDTVRVARKGDTEVDLTSLLGRQLVDGPAAVMGHDFSVPDLERWTPWVTRGDLTGTSMTVAEWPERTRLEPVPSLRQRYRRQRDLEKACRAVLSALSR